MRLRHFLGLVELRTKLVSASTLLFAGLHLAWRGEFHHALPFGLACLAALLVDMGTTAFNSFFDAWRGLDRRASNREPDKVIVHEGVPALAALLVALGLFAVAAGFGLLLAFLSGAWVLWAGALAMLVGFSYSGGPLPISRTPIGEPVAGGFLGSFLFLVVFRIGAGFWDGASFLASLPQAAMIAAILAVNNACDREEDLAHGRRTLAILVGSRVAPWIAVLWSGTGLVLAVCLPLAGLFPRTEGPAAVLAAAVALHEYRAMFRRGFGRATKSANMGGILRILLWWSFFLALGYGVTTLGFFS